jgi:CelD/BcsL family acetyltransferase involved in cellulose biosynthesis
VRPLELDDPRWVDFVESRPEATIFHHPAWARLLADCYGYRAMAIAQLDGGAVSAGIPVLDVSLPFRRRWVALPFTDHCPPLVERGGSELVAGFADLARSSKLDLLEIRAPLPADGAVQTRTPFVRHELQLVADSATLWKQLRRNHRRSVVDAEEAGVRVERGVSTADLEVFYRLHLETRRRLGVPIQPRRFFRLLHERIIAPGLGFVLTAYLGDRPAAAAVFAAWNGTVVCKYSARADTFVKVDAIHLIFWSAIRWASENGFRAFDLGRSNVEQAQLRSFKTGWTAREEPLPYSWIARAPIGSSSRRLHVAMGAMIRNSAPWVCRATGELLYKYAT